MYTDLNVACKIIGNLSLEYIVFYHANNMALQIYMAFPGL